MIHRDGSVENLETICLPSLGNWHNLLQQWLARCPFAIEKAKRRGGAALLWAAMTT
jgi:hypothetical protein